MDTIALAILILCFLALIIYLRTKKYDTLFGAALVALALSAAFLKLYSRGYSDNLFNSATLVSGGLFVMVPTLIICIVLYLIRKNKLRLGYAIALLPIYIIFGLLQQLFFQYLFLESVYSMLGSLWPAVIIGALFYVLFHFSPEFDSRSKLILLLLDMLWGYSYLVHHNIIWLALSHGIGATAFYTFMIKRDMIKTRLSAEITSLLPRY